MLAILGEMDYEPGRDTAFHYGAIRTHTKMFKLLGPDTGFDSIGVHHAKAYAKFLDTLNTRGKLTKIIPSTTSTPVPTSCRTMLGNFQDGTVP